MTHLNILTAFIPMGGDFFRAARHPDPAQNALLFLGVKGGKASEAQWQSWFAEAEKALSSGSPHQLLGDAGHGGTISNDAMRSQPWFAVFEADNAAAKQTEIWAARMPANLTPISGSQDDSDDKIRYLTGNASVDFIDGDPALLTSIATRSVIFADIGAVDSASSGLKEQGCAEDNSTHQRRDW